MAKKLIQFLVMSFLLTSVSFAETNKKFELKYSNIEVTVPNKWQSVQKLFGMPLMILGPEVQGKKPVISITSTNIKNISSDSKKIEKNKEGYITGRKKWISKRNGKIIDFLPYEKENWPNIKEAHVIGYSYDLGENRFIEKTYYVNCNDKLFNIKTLITNKHSIFNKKIETILRSFKCS